MKRHLFLVTIVVVGALTGQAQTLAVKKQIINKLIAKEQLTQKKVNEHGGIKKTISVQSIDLNRDGKPEYIVGCNCETMYAIYVFRKTTDDVEIIFEGSQRQEIKAINTYTKGWRNLQLTSYSAGTGDVDYQTLRWNGTEYK
jgi:hypothetical protein